jgi:hypothetical protein
VDRLADREIRLAIINCSRREAADMVLPRNSGALDWEQREFLGWRDPKAPLRAYIVFWRPTGAVGIMLRAAESARSRRVNAVCMLCRTGRSADSISLFTARRTGPAGRLGNTVGTYICADLDCSANVRVTKATPSLQPDPGLSVEQRVVGLITRLDSFVSEVERG